MILYFRLSFFILIFSFLIIGVAHADMIADAPLVQTLLANVLTFLLQIAGILGIIAVVVSGIMIFLAGGDAERAKKAKQMMVYSVVGIAVVLGALMVVRTISGVL